jgi:hypothetical protein
MDALVSRGVPESQRANFVKVLERLIAREQDEEQLSPEAAFLSVGIAVLGFDKAEGFLTDGPKDYGFDFVTVTNESCTIFQSKSINFSSGTSASRLRRATLMTYDKSRRCSPT